MRAFIIQLLNTVESAHNLANVVESGACFIIPSHSTFAEPTSPDSNSLTDELGESGAYGTKVQMIALLKLREKCSLLTVE